MGSAYDYPLWELMHMVSHQFEVWISHQESQELGHHPFIPSHSHHHDHRHHAHFHHHGILEVVVKTWKSLDHFPNQQLPLTQKFSQLSIHIINYENRKYQLSVSERENTGRYVFSVKNFIVRVPHPPPWT